LLRLFSHPEAGIPHLRVGYFPKTGREGLEALFNQKQSQALRPGCTFHGHIAGKVEK
jgi:hypothetical protein